MCGPAALPVLKFLAPMVLPSLVNRVMGGNKQPKPSEFKQTATPGTKVANAAAAEGLDEEKKEATTKQELEQNVSQKAMRDRLKNPNRTTGAVSAPEAAGVGSNIGGTGQQTGGITAPVAAAY